MYDYIRLSQPITSEIPNIIPHLDYSEPRKDKKGRDYVFGKLGNLIVLCYENWYIIEGSLAKFFFGNNIQTLSINTTQDAINKLYNSLHCDLSFAKVRALEFGTNIPVRKPVEDYLKLLGEMPRIERHQFNRGSLYYENDCKYPLKKYKFYDKIEEGKNKGVIIPKELWESHLLRYELRLNHRINSQIGVPYLEASMLVNPNVFKTLVRMWYNGYWAIEKKKQLKIDLMNDIKTPKNAFEAFIAWKLGQTDNAQIQEFIEGLKQANVFRNRKDYTDLKKMFKRMQDKACISASNELILELDEAVKNEAAKYNIL